MTATMSAIHRTAGSGDAYWAMGGLFEMKLLPDETGGLLGVAEVTQPPGMATPLHVHHNEAELFYVLTGSIWYEAGGVLHELEAGSLIWLPASVPHRFRIRGTDPARYVAITAPGGLLEMYREVGRPAGERVIPEEVDPDEIARWGHTAPRYGLEVLGPPLQP